MAGVKLTMSFGVSASKWGSEFDYDAVFAEADAALYEAKRGGRDQVVSERRKPCWSLSLRADSRGRARGTSIP